MILENTIIQLLDKEKLDIICKEIADKYGLSYANSGYHIELTRKNFLDITDIDDLKQACEDVISIQKIIYKKSINFMYNNMDQMDF